MREKSRELSFTRHWVRIRLDGFRPERLISQASERGIPIKDLNWKDETEVYLTIPSAGYKKFEKIAKSRYHLTVVGEGGVVTLAKHLKRNKLAVAGFVLAMAFYFVQLGFVKEVNVFGCETIPEDQLRTILAEEGLYEGAAKTFDCDRIEERLFKEYENVVWAKVSYQGRYVQVEISEGEVQEQTLPDRSKPCDLVAERDGYIEKVRTYMGRSMVGQGDFVRKGDILITGIVPIEHPSYPVDEKTPNNYYVHAEGEIMARVPYYFSFFMDKGSLDTEVEAEIRRWTKENIPENAEILNKDFHFDAKKNIIKVYGMIETRQKIGIEKEINIDERQESRIEENSD